ncbi:MAG: CoA-binding protein [Promethearchaeota archaeon]|jgi:acyl-CoA synthetase (NDP forming)
MPKLMLSVFFYPESIAIIGATANPKKFGNAVTTNILKNQDLTSKVYLVSRGSKEIEGLKTYNSILDISADIDIAIILVPANSVESVVDQCIEKEVKGIIIITSGFGEWDEEGKERERIIVNKCKEAEIRVIGPNCVGIQNADIGLNASFIQTPPQGEISLISQSGSFGCAVFYQMERAVVGCSKFANIGNGVDVSFDDFLTFFTEDENTKIICIYLETLSHGRKFYEKLKEITTTKPVIVLKGGKTATGMLAAQSHTGSIASNYEILKTAMIQAGAIMCENVSDFITAIKTFSFLVPPDGDRVGILTNSGGNAVFFSDNVDEFNLKLAEFSDTLKEKISPHLISLVQKINPLDMIGVAEEQQYYNVAKEMFEDPGIDIIVGSAVIPPFLGMKSDEHYRGLIRAWNETGRKKPLIPLFLFSEGFTELKELAKKEKVPIFYTPHEAAYAINLLIKRKIYLNRKSP